MGTEVFEYAMVKKVMNEDAASAKQNAKAALDKGTEELKSSIGLSINPENPGVAMAGNAAANIAAKWDNLSAEFDRFVQEINTRIENANAVAAADQAFESEVQGTVGTK